MKIVLDIDGVCCEFSAVFDNWVKEHYGHDPIAANRWAWFEDYPNGQAMWDEFYFDPDHLLPGLVTAGTVAGAREGVAQLLARHDVAFATYRFDWTLDVTAEWLRTVLGVPDPVLHHVKDKSTVPGDLYIDDHPQTISGLLEKDCLAFLFDRPSNQVEGAGLPRVMGWDQLVPLADALALRKEALDV